MARQGWIYFYCAELRENMPLLKGWTAVPLSLFPSQRGSNRLMPLSFEC